eukprot:CAMPEP_0197324836 /NCGR_PEP_ID=MMETSP0891-20130614/71335_1 /TAXON_ID=44058 ORGANISM="Aureoumbra lagunensis, Strain CCMP1510" /NCGR_SAMPLE_ID=MMETSP0891 /ASSEMBLY_ACC=CAM_ASM_000534 /LENGTH=540 /DNA_ID=CAMNT_0042817711 /DNA_START=436 /DNA_END=2058 /DNA_ORIENTATION=+
MSARDAAFSGISPPASTLLIVNGFSKPEFLVEVEAVAAVQTVSAKTFRRRRISTRRMKHRFSYSQRLHLSTQQIKPDEEQLARFAQDVRASGAKVILASAGANQKRECLRRSRDYFWYSPILKKKLDGYSADAVVAATKEEHVVAAARAAATYNVPIITRGGGTGNYGQISPVRGGAILDVSGFCGIISLNDGVCRAFAGTKLSEIEDTARQQGWELRQHPSTRREATIGGFVAGGSTGHGALLHGGLAEDGAVLGLTVISAEKEPRILHLSEPNELNSVIHAYGTNGIITQVEFPLARVQPWVDAIFSFDNLGDAATFAIDVANAPAIITRAVAVFQAPIAASYLELPEVSNSSNVVTVQFSPAALASSLWRLAKNRGGNATTADQPTQPSETKPRALYLNSWNHTTLHALKKDKNVTYLQAAYASDNALHTVAQVQNFFPTSKLLQHLECVNMNGRVGFAVLSLIWPQDDNELLQILEWHEKHDIPIFNPHDETIEGGGMKGMSISHQLNFKRITDPAGILNPGKMRCYDEEVSSNCK